MAKPKRPHFIPMGKKIAFLLQKNSYFIQHKYMKFGFSVNMIKKVNHIHVIFCILLPWQIFHFILVGSQCIRCTISHVVLILKATTGNCGRDGLHLARPPERQLALAYYCLLWLYVSFIHAGVSHSVLCESPCIYIY